MKPFLFSLLFLFTFASHLPAASAQSEYPFYDQGLHLYSVGRYNDALNAFNKHLSDHPGHAIAYLYRGYTFMFLEQDDYGKKDFYQANRLLPGSALVLSAMGFYYNRQQQYGKALRFLNKAVDADPKLAQAYNNRGISHQYLGHFRLALSDYNQAILLDSTMALAYNNRGTATFYNQDISAATRSDIEAAIRDFEKALRYAPAMCITRRNIGLAYAELKEYETAVEKFSDALRCNAQDASSYASRGLANSKLEKYEAAINDFMAALKINPELAQAQFEMGKAKTALGYHDQAIEDLQEAISIDKSYTAAAYYEIALAHAAKENMEQTLNYLEKARKKGYFRDKDHRQDLLTNKAFNLWRKDKDFSNFVKKVL